MRITIRLSHKRLLRSLDLSKLLAKRISVREILFLAVGACAVLQVISPPIALIAGFCVAQFVGHPYIKLNGSITNILLQASVIGLGFGMNFFSTFAAGKQQVPFILCSILGTFSAAMLLRLLLKTDKKTSYLIASGTAICGGSAIAAVAPVIRSDEKQNSVALGVVFILNSLALFIFPYIGHKLKLSDQQFGMWCAIAIHDTSSVVAAAERFSTTALSTATAIKLTRALWIIPLSLVSMRVFRSGKQKLKLPWFIVIFTLVTLLQGYVPMLHKIAPYITNMAKSGLTLTLYLIGCGLSLTQLQSLGLRPMIFGTLLWIGISMASLLYIVLA